MIQEINQGNAEQLHIRAEEIDLDELQRPEFKNILEDLKDTFDSIKNSTHGLSMNQIWKYSDRPFRVFIAWKPEQDKPEVFINPRGVGSGGTIRNDEGCTSFQKKGTKKKGRHKNYTIVYIREDGSEASFKVGPPWSRVLQHEMDHLDGKTLF